MQIVDTIRAWCAAHPYVTAYAAIAVLSIALRLAGSTWWAGMKQRHPKLAGLLEVARGAGFDFVKIAQGLLRILYAMLPPPISGSGSGETKPKTPPTVIVGSLFVLVLVLPACGSTPAAKSPAIEQSTAVLVLGARVVHGADVACASAGRSLRDAGKPADAAKLTDTCVDALRPAADALDAVSVALDAGAAVADKQVTCAIVLGVDAVVRLRPVLEAAGVKLPATVETYVRAAAPWIRVAEGMVCS